MGAYVDELIWERAGQLWCHLTADTAEELHALASMLGLRRSRFQSTPDRPWVDPYDIAEPARRRAVALGAVEIRSRRRARSSPASERRLKGARLAD